MNEFVSNKQHYCLKRNAAEHYLPIKRMNMKIELENCQKSLTLKDFEEVESKLGHVLPERLKEFYLPLIPQHYYKIFFLST